MYSWGIFELAGFHSISRCSLLRTLGSWFHDFHSPAKPKLVIAHREKVQRVITLVFLIAVPISLVGSYAYESEAQVGFILPLPFIFLAVSKIWDDVQRLSLLKTENQAKDQNLNNYGLTKREKEIAQLLVKGHTYNHISDQLFISIPTVKSHTSNIYSKCKVKTRAELISLLIN